MKKMPWFCGFMKIFTQLKIPLQSKVFVILTSNLSYLQKKIFCFTVLNFCVGQSKTAVTKQERVMIDFFYHPVLNPHFLSTQSERWVHFTISISLSVRFMYSAYAYINYLRPLQQLWTDEKVGFHFTCLIYIKKNPLKSPETH